MRIVERTKPASSQRFLKAATMTTAPTSAGMRKPPAMFDPMLEASFQNDAR